MCDDNIGCLLGRQTCALRAPRIRARSEPRGLGALGLHYTRGSVLVQRFDCGRGCCAGPGATSSATTDSTQRFTSASSRQSPARFLAIFRAMKPLASGVRVVNCSLLCE